MTEPTDKSRPFYADGGGIVTMKRVSVRRVASVIVTAMAMTLVFATLGWAMMPQWNTRPYTQAHRYRFCRHHHHPAHADIPHEGAISYA